MATKEQLRFTLFAGLIVLLVAALFTATPVSAAGAYQEGDDATTASTSTGTQSEECQECHTTITHDWEQSKHGQSNSLPFKRAWKTDGEDPECLTCHTGGKADVVGLDCDTCHNPMPASHPDQIMPTPSDAETCGACHTDTFHEWEQSGHGAEGMACSNCHNPHTSELKVGNPQALCQDCHTNESHFFSLTSHASEGLICSDCHLRVTGETATEAHSPRLHTFEVGLQSCTQCHGKSMHFPVQLSKELDAPELVTEEASLRFPVTERAQQLAETPSEANPFTYILAAVAGIGIGFIVSPGVDSIYRRFKRH
ncbi:MAG: cytochrome c3 family protein [Anaerolineae bacterium]|nr:cytochrome c3 family protein [Anaerolineae bacterium]